jgi:hypothetical protein
MKEQFESVCNAYAERFCERHDMEFNGWVGDVVGGVAYCSEYTFNLLDMVWDVNTNQPIMNIVRWMDYCLGNPEHYINYITYCKIR